MKLSFTTLSAALFCAALLLPLSARADAITLKLDNPVQAISSTGGTLSFSGTVTNTSSSTQYFSADNLLFSFGNQSYVFDDSSFYNSLFSLDPGDKYVGNLFTITIGSGAAVNAYSGTYSLLGGTNPDFSQQNLLASAGIQANVMPPSVAITPEPSTVFLLGTGLLAIAFAYRREALL